MGRKAQAEHTKLVILEAAIDLYAERGFRGTGLMAIGERAGVAHATVLYHYGTSRELLMAVLEERERRFQRAASWAGRRSGLDILRHLPDIARFHLAEPKLAKLFAVLQAENLEPHHDANAFFRQRRREVREVLQHHLRHAVAAGEIRPDVDVDRTGSPPTRSTWSRSTRTSPTG
jgi:AcrR family transcriptional regulator